MKLIEIKFYKIWGFYGKFRLMSGNNEEDEYSQRNYHKLKREFIEFDYLRETGIRK